MYAIGHQGLCHSVENADGHFSNMVHVCGKILSLGIIQDITGLDNVIIAVATTVILLLCTCTLYEEKLNVTDY